MNLAPSLGFRVEIVDGVAPKRPPAMTPVRMNAPTRRKAAEVDAELEPADRRAQRYLILKLLRDNNGMMRQRQLWRAYPECDPALHRGLLRSLVRSKKIEVEGSGPRAIIRLLGHPLQACTVVCKPEADLANTLTMPGGEVRLVGRMHPVEAALQRAIDTAQDALDVYVCAIGDAELLRELQGARDRARQALQLWKARQST